ncbi:MAG TPA: hypothetical protein VGO57_04965 [Verrucomicrobiae bacterium]|jgi:hypothetical protein
MFVALTLGTSGCGGISATRTVSPLDFIMPGLLKAAPPATNAPVVLVQDANTFAFAK